MNDDKHLSEKQVRERVNLYSRLGNERQYFDIQKIKRAYEIKKQKLEQNRIQRDAYYSQGIRKGLPHSSYQKLTQQRELEDAKSRATLLKETKALYRKGNNLSKWLNKEVGKPKTMHRSIPETSKTKPKIIPRRLSPHFNSPVLTKTFNKVRTIDKER